MEEKEKKSYREDFIGKTVEVVMNSDYDENFMGEVLAIDDKGIYILCEVEDNDENKIKEWLYIKEETYDYLRYREDEDYEN